MMDPDDCGDLVLTEQGDRACAETGFLVTVEDCRECLLEWEEEE